MAIHIAAVALDDPRWPLFVKQFERVNIFSSPEMAAVFHVAPGFRVYPLLAEDQGRPLAFALPVLVRCSLPVPSLFASRLVLYASPLYIPGPEGRAGLNALLKEAKRIARRTAFFLEIRHSEPFPRNGDEDTVAGMHFVPRLNYLLDLSAGAEALLARLSTDTRNRIRKALRRGLVIRPLESVDELRAGTTIIVDLYHRKRVPMVDPAVFAAAYEKLAPRGMFRAVGAFKGDELVAVRFCLNYAATIVDWFAAAQPDSQRDYPNEALVWDSIVWGCLNGYRFFDFGGGGLKGKEYGPGKFKEKFCPELLEYGRHRHSIWRPALRIVERLFEY